MDILRRKLSLEVGYATLRVSRWDERWRARKTGFAMLKRAVLKVI